MSLTRERFLEIMSSKDDAGSDVSVDWAWEGLSILKKYAKHSVIVGADHDVIYSITITEAIDGGITEEEAENLLRWNWMVVDEEYLHHFV